MINYVGIILMAGSSSRYRQNENKVLTKVLDKEIYKYSLEIFLKDNDCQKIYLMVSEEVYPEIIKDDTLNNDRIEIVIGGTTRLESVQKGLKSSQNEKIDYYLIHDAARPLIKADDIELIKDHLINYDGIALYEACYDTIRYQDNDEIRNLKRENIYKIVTPQGFSNHAAEVIQKADYHNLEYTDEITILLEQNLEVKHLKINHSSPKLTTIDDLDYITYLLKKEYNLNEQDAYKIGHSFDFHPFEEGTSITIGGVEIPFNKKLKGWSDADVLYHAIAESIIGALGLVDLGTLYPDNDEKYRGINSKYFLKDMRCKLKELNYEIVNIDSIIYLEKPNLKKYKNQMVLNIQKELGLDNGKVNVKATTMEKKGLVGKGEGIGAEAITLIKYRSDF